MTGNNNNNTGNAAMPAIGYRGRADATRAYLAERGDVAALAVTDLTNVRWLTGFTGSNARVAVLPDRLVLVTDGRYRDRATDELGAADVPAEIVVGATHAEQQAAFAAAFDGVALVGADSRHLSHAAWQALAADVAITPVDGVIEDLRRVKDPGEIARIRAAARAADAALAEVAPTLGDGVTEADVRDELEYRMRRHGADGPSYATIVAAGPTHAARPHHEPTRRTIVDGDTVVIDVGGLVDGYHSDMTRSYVVGEPSAEQADHYRLLLDVQLAGLAAVRARIRACDIDAVCRDLVAAAGLGDHWMHSTGHGVGLVIHEDPFLSPVVTTELRVGDVVTVEPGLYRVGFGGFRIEDLVAVTDDGYEILTATPKDTPCLPSRPTT